ncbi:MAG: L,D-transpeptidase family protein [Bacteroidota bacterium]|nr:MAG: L,D-transpeptidase family protein [Bacteroidota bacterium]
METGNLISKPTNPTLHSSRRILTGFLHYFLLIGLFLLLASHENINPRKNNSHIDFSVAESKRLLQIQALAYQLNPVVANSLQYQLNELISDFYKTIDFNPVWTINHAGTDKLNELIRLVDSAVYFGLPESVINSSKLKSLSTELESSVYSKEKMIQRIDLEIEATKSAFLLMIYLNQGIVDSDTSSRFMNFIAGLPQLLMQSMEKDQLEADILALQPDIQFYNELISLLNGYQKTLEKVRKAKLEIAQSDLASAFFYLGFLSSPVFDSTHTLQKVVSDYQQEKRIEITGKLNNVVIKHLLHDLDKTYELIALNLDRLRKLNLDSNSYVFVNIPAYQLSLVKENFVEKNFKVIVGKMETPTPIFSSTLACFITNPHWTVPTSIANDEMLENIRKDSTYLESHGYIVVNNNGQTVNHQLIDWTLDNPLSNKYYIRQQNSGNNALGKIKFLFPNEHSVFMHDTPSKALFNKTRRTFSHGCIRVQNPDELAQSLSEYVFAKENKPINIESIIKSEEQKVFHFNRKVDVHVQYLTCMVDSAGRLNLLPDVYARDQEELSQLFDKDDVSL